MPFPIGINKDQTFKTGESGNPKGKPLGAKNRSTVIKEIFNMSGKLPDEMFNALKVIFPDIGQKMTFEEIISVAQMGQAVKGDTSAYKAVMDSAYGAPKQDLNVQGTILGKDINEVYED